MQIQVSNLHKSYIDGEGLKLHILQGLNFEAKSGSTVAIVGASGTGKSTFLHTIGMLEGIDEGQLYLDGSDLANLTATRLHSSGMKKLVLSFNSTSYYRILLRWKM